MSQENVHDNNSELQQGAAAAIDDNNNEQSPPPGDSLGGAGDPVSQAQDQQSSNDRLQATEVQRRRRTEALERILMGSDSNLSLPHPTARRVRFENARRLRGQHRQLLNRTILPRREMERAIFIPFRTRGSVSAINLPSTQGVTREPNNPPANNLNPDGRRLEFSRVHNGSHPRINVSSFFMELTYSTAEPNGINLLKNSTEAQKRRLEIHAANTMNIVKNYCPAKPHKMNQFRFCTRTQSDDVFNFQNFTGNPLEELDPTQVKCNTKVVVIIRDDPSAKWNSPFTPFLLGFLSKKHLNPTCITFQSETFLNTLVEQLNDDLHVFPKNTNTTDSTFNTQAKKFLVVSTFAKIIENWSVPLIVFDSCTSKLADLDEIIEFCKRFQIKIIDVDSSVWSGGGKQKKAGAKRIRHQIRKALIECNIKRVGEDMKHILCKKKPLNVGTIQHANECANFNNLGASPISDDCRRIFFNLHERISISLSLSLEQQKKSCFDKNASGQSDLSTQISLLEDGILADIENADAFKYPRNVHTPKSCRVRRSCVENEPATREKGESRPKTSHSNSDEDYLVRSCSSAQINFAAPLGKEQEKISELLFNELNQRWRVHGPQRCIPKTADAGPYCNGMTDAEKQLLLSILQEVTYFEMLKDIRNELKDSKKDLEGRLYGYNPDFTNLIASAEEFLHGKAASMEPCKDEVQFYKMPVSFVLSDSEVKFLKSKPPTYVVGQESPSQLIKLAIEESTKLFMDAVIRTACGSRRLFSSRSNRTKVVVVIEDNTEALELLIAALWFFEKTPLATFQSKYYYNTAEFLLSLDACRFYFRSYPAHSITKKDEERIFERWLGVGMNGILRSHQSKILLIDFPCPGMHLQHSKNVLMNRLKLEEKLNNIKSLIICKPSRKEDNLSSVEKILDEIQKALEPRDKLLFRKSRRMYMDLKLYKQIEQKSRQDLKALREWGLPEPDNEHELWEKLRNSELVINDIQQPSRESDISELFEAPDSEVVNCESSCCYEEDTSEPESILADKSETSKKSNSEDINFISECDESLESLTVGEDQTSVTADNINHYFTTLQFHANRSNGACRGGSSNSAPQSRKCESRGSVDSGKDTTTINCQPNNESKKMGKIASQSNSSNDALNLKCISKSPEAESHNTETKNHIRASSPQNLKRSAGILNLLDTSIFTEKAMRFNPKKNAKGIKNYGIMNAEVSTAAFTKLEFTLPPNEGVSSCSSSSYLAYSQKAEETSANVESSLVDKASNVAKRSDDVHTDDNHKNQHKKSARRKSMPDLCVAYISKWGKSLSRALHKKTLRKPFPTQLYSSFRPKGRKTVRKIKIPPPPFSKQSESLLCSAVSGDTKVEGTSDSLTSIAKEDIRPPSRHLHCEKQESSSRIWLRNFLGHFGAKSNTKSKQRQPRRDSDLVE